MADYNVNMKQWNGTSFDNVLPLAYNAKQLGGTTLAELKTWVQDNNLLLCTGQYTGTGTYGKKHPTSITFPFKPILIFPPFTNNGSSNTRIGPVQSSYIKTSYGKLYSFNPTTDDIYAKLSSDGKTLQWYNESSANYQFNYSKDTYYYAAIGGYDMGVGATEWMITRSGTWIVPKTGRYYMELYGGGGGAWNNPYSDFFAYQGGSSCQTYDSVMLTAGNTINVSIGVGGGYSNYTEPAPNPLDSTGTTFGSYSVAGGGRATNSSGGAAAGNKGTVGGNKGATNPSSGTFGNLYGYGGFGTTSTGSNGGPGAVYLKYLGD